MKLQKQGKSVKLGPGGALGDLGAVLGVLGAIFLKFLRGEASWRQVMSKMGHDSAKMAILGSTWEVLGAC